MKPGGAETCSGWRAGGSFEGQPAGVGHSWARPATPDLSAVREVGVELAGDVTLQGAHDLGDGFALGAPGWFRGRRVAGGLWGARPATPDLSAVRGVGVELAGDVTLQGAHDLGDGFALGAPAGDVFAGAFVAAHAGEHDAPQRVVRLA